MYLNMFKACNGISDLLFCQGCSYLITTDVPDH